MKKVEEEESGHEMEMDLSLKMDAQEEEKTDDQPPQSQNNQAQNKEFQPENKLKEKSQEIVADDDHKSIEYYSLVNLKKEKV